MTLHDTKEFDNDFGRRTNENLTFSTTFGIDDVVKTIVLQPTTSVS